MLLISGLSSGSMNLLTAWQYHLSFFLFFFFKKTLVLNSETKLLNKLKDCLLEWIYVLLLSMSLFFFACISVWACVCVWERDRDGMREREKVSVCFVWVVFAVGRSRGEIVYVCVHLYISWAHIPIETIQSTYHADWQWHWSR